MTGEVTPFHVGVVDLDDVVGIVDYGTCDPGAPRLEIPPRNRLFIFLNESGKKGKLVHVVKQRKSR